MCVTEVYKCDWFRRAVDELRQYRLLKKRIEVIEILLYKQCIPDAKVIANYGINTYESRNSDEISRLEVELVEKQTWVKAIEKSLEILDEHERKIIEQKFMRGHSNEQIYTMEGMSRSTFYEYYNEAITKIAKCLGFLGC